METEQRTISKIGDSYGVTIPVSMLEELNLQQGNKVKLELVDGKIHLSKDKQVSLQDGISDDFPTYLEDILFKYEATIKGLTQR